MKQVKIVYETIISISKDECKKMLDKKKEGKEFSCDEKKCFLVEPYDFDVELYVALDNRDGECILYSSSTLSDVISYICDIPLLATELMKHE